MIPRPAGPVEVTCWGTRGSIPCPGPETVGFGGNTPCLEIRTADGRGYVFDAGTGLRVLGNVVMRRPAAVDLDLFLTHFHWDHIQGLPFFAPLHQETTSLRVHAHPQGETDVETLLRTQMGPVYFPVPYESVAPRLSFEPVGDQPWTDRGVEVAAYRVRHPGYTCGYRIRIGSVAVGYVPDNELVGSAYPVDGDGWYRGLLRFLDGVDVLYHDAMFTDEEYARAEGWGHSTFSQAIRLGEDAGVGRLLLFHHAPDRTDQQLAAILLAARADIERRGSKLQLGIATEAETILL